MNHKISFAFLKRYVCIVLVMSTVLSTCIVFAQSTFEETRRGTVCKQNAAGSLNCSYKVGKDLEFSMAAVGELDTGISFLQSNIKGDYYARFGVMHGCVVIAQGESTPKSAPNEYAFVSPKSGRVYRTWEECKGGK